MGHLMKVKLQIQGIIPNRMTVNKFIRNVPRFVYEFTHNSNIHGVRYFTERLLHWSERLWWIIAVSVSLWFCCSMIRHAWQQWDEHPIKFDFDEKTHISMIPFPTVTICSEIKSMKSKLDISTKYNMLQNLTAIEIFQLSAISTICPYLQHKIKYPDNYVNESIYGVIEDLAPNLEYIINACWWQQTKINCSDYMIPTLTRRGLCFSFNALNSYDLYTDEVAPSAFLAKKNRNISHWSLDGYETELTESEYPFRGLSSGRRGALELLLTSSLGDSEFKCNEDRRGFELLVTQPGDLVQPYDMLSITFSEDIIATTKPKITITSSGLRSYSPTQRECFFESERKLRFFKFYTTKNCLTECMSNFVKKECGCVRFSMPRDADTRICGAGKVNCYEDAETRFNSIDEFDFRTSCNCLQPCKYYEFDNVETRFNISREAIKMAQDPQTNASGQQFTRLTILFANDYAETKIKMKTHTYGDFFATCGGLLGIFLGVSVLSIIEVIYYFSLRLLWIVHWSKLECDEEHYEQRDIDVVQSGGDTSTNQNQEIQRSFCFTSKIWAFFREFSDNSNVHGVRYLGERMLHWSERLWWLAAVSVSLCLCGFMIRSVLIQWMEDNITMVYFDESAGANTIPFPTVTVCPILKTTRTHLDLDAAINSLSNLSDIGMARLNALAHICPVLSNQINYTDHFSDESIYDTIQDDRVYPTSFVFCGWQSVWFPCLKMFSPVMTDEGLCYAFNALNSHDIYTDEMAPGMMITTSQNISGWSLDGGYTSDNPDENYPIQGTKEERMDMVGIGGAVSLREVTYWCNGLDRGFKLFLNMPGEIVGTSQNYVLLASAEQILIFITRKLTITSKGLRNYKPKQRQCFYNSENPLRFFRIYTESNCKEECLSNFTKIECGCVKFSMPRDRYTKICGGANIKCYKMAQRTLLTSQRGKVFRDNCNCLPSCTSIKYDQMTQRTPLDPKTSANYPDYVRLMMAIVGFQHGFMEIVTRNEKHTIIDFLAVCGSFLGLCLGISLLSIIELVYYSTLRLFWTIKMKRNIQ